jgi:hypothetical protein
MDFLALIVAIAAFLLAVAAFSRTGGLKEVRNQLDNLSSKTDRARDLAANAIDRLEDVVRGADEPEPPGESPSKPQGRQA